MKANTDCLFCSIELKNSPTSCTCMYRVFFRVNCVCKGVY